MSQSKADLKISVVMAVYNAEKFVGEAIESVLAQSFSNFEFIIVHDQSPDNALAILRSYRDQDPRIVLIENERNLGAAAARNVGLKKAKGEYIAIFDADDVCMPDRLLQQADYLDTHQEVFLVGGSFEYINENNEILDKWSKTIPLESVKIQLPLKNIIHNPTVMFRNAGYLYRENFFAAEDYDLWLRMLTDGKKMVVLPDIAIKYRIQKKSISNSNNKILREYVEIARKFYKQRMHNDGNDGYVDFRKPPVVLKVGYTDNSLVKAREIKMYFKNVNEGKKIRKEIILYWNEYGIKKWPASLVYYLLTLIPNKFLKIIKYKILN